VNVQKPGLYRIIYRYVNPTPDDVTADVTVTPEASGDVTQTSHVTFEPTTRRTGPQFTTVSTGSIVTTFVLNPGPLSVALKALPGVLVVSITCLSVCLFVCLLVLNPGSVYVSLKSSPSVLVVSITIGIVICLSVCLSRLLSLVQG